MFKKINLVTKSFNLLSGISFLFNAFQSVFADFLFGILYFLIFEKLYYTKMHYPLLMLLTFLVFLYFVFLIPFWGYHMEKGVNIYTKNLTNLVFKTILNRDNVVHSSENITLIQHDVINDSKILGWDLVVFFQAILSGIISTIVIFNASYKMLLFLYILGLIAIILNLFFIKIIKKLYLCIRKNIEFKIKYVSEYVNNLIIVNIYGLNQSMESDILKVLEELYKQKLRIKIYETITFFIDNMVYKIGFKLVIIIYGMYLVSIGSINFGYLLLCFSMVEGIIFFLSYTGEYISVIQKLFISISKVNTFLYSKRNSENSKFVLKPVSRIEFKDVFFKFFDSKEYLINGLNLEFDFSNNYIICGKNGIGKSTIFKLIFGILKPDKGSINFNYCKLGNSGNPVYVSQEPLIFSGTVRENILLDKRNVSDDKIYKALQTVCLDNWVDSLDDGLDFYIDEKVSVLSKGEKMRLTIARALITNPQILFLDEPDANLDIETIKLIINNIKKLYKCKFMIISHLTKYNIYDEDFKIIEL